MKKLTDFFKRLRLGQILTLFLSVVLLFVSTACSGGDLRGARPENPSVQAGGMNNPHKGGGEGSTNYKMSTDPQVNTTTTPSKRDRADVGILSNLTIAAAENADTVPTVADPNAKLLYRGSEPLKTDQFDRNQGKTSEQRQPGFNRSESNANVLERAGAAFQDASGFLKDRARDAGDRPASPDIPALHNPDGSVP